MNRRQKVDSQYMGNFPEEKKRKKRAKSFLDGLWINKRPLVLGKAFRKKHKQKMIPGVGIAFAVIAVYCTVEIFGIGIGYDVTVDGEYVGLVSEKKIAFDAIESARLVVKEQLGEDAEFEKTPAFAYRLITKRNLSDKEEICSELLSNVDSLTNGYMLCIDGADVLGLSSREEAEELLKNYRQKYVGETITDDMAVDFCENVEIKKEFFHISKLENMEQAAEILENGKKEVRSYTVQKGERIKTIADKFGTSIEHILAMNKGVGETLNEGMELRFEQRVPLLSVRSVQTVAITEPVDYDIEKIKDDSSYEDEVKITRRGSKGAEKVLARITKVNGVETERSVLDRETIYGPVKQIEKVGTKKRPATTGSGAFINPSFGVLSSRYGSRWGRNHNGIDIAGAHNTDIKAADGGVVTYAGWMSGYGNYVTVDHENGYQTAYAHCSSLCVSVGARVAKGDVIAKMGSTGRSTGTHLHFEVKKNGVFVNPLEFVTY